MTTRKARPAARARADREQALYNQLLAFARKLRRLHEKEIYAIAVENVAAKLGQQAHALREAKAANSKLRADLERVQNTLERERLELANIWAERVRTLEAEIEALKKGASP